MDIQRILTQIERENAAKKQMMFTLWDVGHGLSIWIQTPNGHNHWIDAGWYPETGFCPAHHVRHHYGETELDYLVISHPDLDHLHNLPKIIEHLGKPRVLRRNKSLPDREKFGDEQHEYQKKYKELDGSYGGGIEWSENPRNPDYNGGVTIEASCLSYREGMNKNNTSIVMFYSYKGWLFCFPGDIEEAGWLEFWSKYASDFQPLIDGATYRILVAPHHGRQSVYCQDMMDTIDPAMVLISDKYGMEPTHDSFRTKPNGIAWTTGEKKFLSTKTGGRIQFTVKGDGQCNYSQAPTAS
ncbi:hypothetical protein PDESU_01939 [Pontiella desulfatans]|uniref:Metallo-beta-lactamase domain-containing protein n=1 Tax=Pontiella desulfatans TaxID=2750659 RepID=A0A6C2U0D3_PONDE|nr:MBL fold metallo-hydrolase [Pontiella desulfatans]VGO13382.1 hypothetical protein PDESU_01939 [Pontiella desulfatans]